MLSKFAAKSAALMAVSKQFMTAASKQVIFQYVRVELACI